MSRSTAGSSRGRRHVRLHQVHQREPGKSPIAVETPGEGLAVDDRAAVLDDEVGDMQPQPVWKKRWSVGAKTPQIAMSAWPCSGTNDSYA
jgi:hypothetical protein